MPDLNDHDNSEFGNSYYAENDDSFNENLSQEASYFV
jgi:hypothetical protein